MNTDTQFAGLGLAQPLLRAIADAGYTVPTPIQLKAIPLVMSGRDLLAAAQTGTGKTAGFVLPILHALYVERPTPASTKRPRCLILTPTRELAAQIEESVRTYGAHLPLKSTMIFGGVGMQPQVDKLRKGVDILVATPGRLLDHAGQKTVDLSGIEVLVLDEADRMLDMGFIHDIRRVLALLPKKRQSLLFSATFSEEIRALAAQFLEAPASVDVAPRNTASELVRQTVHLVAKDHKRDVLSHLIRTHAWEQVLVFTRTKHGANRLAEKLERDGIPAAAIHGNKSQNARTRALAQFKAGEVPVLVATDIAARGLDIEELPHVVNFELPNVAEDYVHRIGRTGRAGSTGEAVSLVDHEEVQLLKAIEKLIGRGIERVTLEGFVPRPASERSHDDRPREPRSQRQHPQHRREHAARNERGSSAGQRHHERRDAPHRGTAGQADSDRDDNRGNRVDYKPAHERSGNRTHGGVRNGEDTRKRRGDEPSRARHPRHEPAPQRAEAADAARPQGGVSEAARHQAMPQPALFRPQGPQRRRG
jgi:ATP-dependent RNA helicase RhlE